MKILESAADSLEPKYQNAIVDKLRGGLWCVTDYSGSGQPEYAMHRLQEWSMNNHGTRGNVRVARSSDISRSCRAVLLKHIGAEG